MQQRRLTESAQIVLRARESLGETQRKFAERLGSAQSLICKYERGEVSPPAKVLIHCMNLVDLNAKEEIISTDELTSLIRQRLGGAQMGRARQAVARLIECMPAAPRRGRGMRSRDPV